MAFLKISNSARVLLVFSVTPFKMGVTKTKTLENEDLRPVLVFEITKTKTP